MANWYISSVGQAAVAQWATNHTYAAGAIVRQLASPAVGSERCFRTPAGGTSHATTEPVWNLGQGATQPTDNTITDWVECTGAEARQAAGAWAAPAARLNSMTKTAYVSAVVVNNQGVATYSVGDILTAAGGTLYGDAATFRVATVSAGKVATVTIRNGGAYSANPTTTGNAVTGGGGTGCTLNLTMSNWSASTDNFYVASNHAETQSTALTIQSQATTTNSQPTILCVDETGTGHVPPTSADLKTTATISTTGNSALTLNTLGNVYGIIFTAGSGTNSVNLAVNSTSGITEFDACAIRLGGTSGGFLSLANSSPSITTLNNTTVQVATAGSAISLAGGKFTWKNTASAITGGTLPTILFSPNLIGPSIVDGVDLSALGSGKTIVGASANSSEINFIDCKLGSSVTVAAAPTTIGGNRTNLIRCDSGGTTYRHERYWFEGTQTVETVIIRTGGASDGTTGISTKIVTTANVAWFHPFEAMPIGEQNTIINPNNCTATLYGILNAVALPNNDELWMDVEYLGTSGSPQASFGSGTKANILASGTPLTADSTSAWDSLATARANNTAKSVGDAMSVSSNPGRLFFCTASTGNTNASLPVGYASCVDGGSVTDGNTTFRAGVRFSMAVTLSAPQPQLAGYLRAIVKAAKASTTWYLDPKLALS